MRVEQYADGQHLKSRALRHCVRQDRVESERVAVARQQRSVVLAVGVSLVARDPGAAEDLPADDHRETGVESGTAEASGIDTNENTVEEGGGGEEDAEPETVRTSSSSAMDAVASGIVNHAVYSAIIQRSHPVQSHPFVDAVLNRPDVKIPPGTVAKVILPSALGDGVEHADSWSLVFVPEDGCSPIQRIVIKTDGTIIERCGPYRSGA